MQTQPVTAAAIRTIARSALAIKLKEPEDVLIDELTMPDGCSRVDVAMVNGHIEAFEIKSDADSLHRLAAQVAGYAPYFDRLSIITGPKHLTAAAGMVPLHWGIAHVKDTSGGLALRWKRSPRSNPQRCFASQLNMLWLEDLRALAKLRLPSVKGMAALNKQQVIELLVENGPSRALRHLHRKLLKVRLHAKFALR